MFPGGGYLLPEKLGGGVRPSSQNPQNLRYFLPYLWPDQKIRNPIYDMTLNIKTQFRPVLNYRKNNLWRAFVDFFSDNDEKVASS